MAKDAYMDELKTMYSITSQALMVQCNEKAKLQQIAAGAALFVLKICREYELDARACSLDVPYWIHALIKQPDIIKTLAGVEVKVGSKSKGETLRQGGMDYTSREIIHKVIDPLFLNDLKSELASIKAETDTLRKVELLTEFQNKLANLNFFDPASGCGNFLVEVYVNLRELENEIIGELKALGVAFNGRSSGQVQI